MEERNRYLQSNTVFAVEANYFLRKISYDSTMKTFKSLPDWRPVCHLSGGEVVFVILVHNYLLNRSRYLLLNV